jgi:hypothetical protein
VIQLAALLGTEVAEVRRRIAAGEISSYVDDHGIERVRHTDYLRLSAERG